MDYKETLEYLYSKLPMFTRVGVSAFKKDLDNTIAVCDHLENPQTKFKSIHVGGTNGKGSTSHMLAAIFQQAGYKTGLYTSPHLKDFRERIKINGEMVSQDYVVDFVRQNNSLIESISPSFFEVTVAMAFDYFAKEHVDIAIIEVGLGGRIDSTNVILPELSVITNISFDHTNLLGNTLKEIAFEKAGIIKHKVPVVIGEYDVDTCEVFVEKSKQTNSEIYFADQILSVEQSIMHNDYLEVSVVKAGKLAYNNLKLDLNGTYQRKNVLTLLTAVEVLKDLGFSIQQKDVHLALSKVKEITGLQGRWQTLSTHPTMICDTGHNPAGIQEIVQNIARYKYSRLHMVIGMVKDKDISKVLNILPSEASYYFCAPDLERALPASELLQQATKFGLKGSVFESVVQAVNAAKANAGSDDMIFIGGSTFVVAEVL